MQEEEHGEGRARDRVGHGADRGCVTAAVFTGGRLGTGTHLHSGRGGEEHLEPAQNWAHSFLQSGGGDAPACHQLARHRVCSIVFGPCPPSSPSFRAHVKANRILCRQRCLADSASLARHFFSPEANLCKSTVKN